MFNNVAVAVQALLDEGLHRVMIWDWDLHHGDGIQRIFARNDSVLYCSVHADSRVIGYPPGDLDQPNKVGIGRRRGLNVNVPLPLSTNDAEYLYAVSNLILPIASAFRPEAVVIAAGFDSHARGIEHPAYRAEQPGFSLSAGLFGVLARLARRVAQPAAGPVILVLEGGYSSHAVADCVKAVVLALRSGRAASKGRVHAAGARVRASVINRVEVCRRHLAEHWDLSG